MPFPSTRMRRLRSSPTFRSLVRETELSPAHLIMPAFVIAGEDAQSRLGDHSTEGVVNPTPGVTKDFG